MWWVALWGCASAPVGTEVDVAERLETGQARAGWIADERALFGGVSAEGRVGDVKIYNERVQFIVQGVRAGSYYLGQGGAVIDADIVRSDGDLGHDAVDEWQGMYGVGRLVEADTVSVVSTGALGGPAIVRVVGHESPMALLEGVLESHDIIQPLGLTFVTDYVLEPDSSLLKVRTTVTAGEQAAEFQPGDLLLAALEVVEPWDPGVGLSAPAPTRDWAGMVGVRNEVALAVARPDGALQESTLDVLGSLLQMATAFGDEVSLAPGESATWTRWYGVGPDLATLSDALQLRRGVDGEVFEGAVHSADGPVARARVNVLVDGAPFTLAVTDAEGRFSARVPSVARATALAVGQGPGRFQDYPPGWTSYAPYSSAAIRGATLQHLAGGSPGVEPPEGRGIADPGDPLTLGVPAVVTFRADDGLPFEVRLTALDTLPSVDPALVPARTGGYAAVGWARDGEITLRVAPGRYRALAHRGIRAEIDVEEITVSVDAPATVLVDLPWAYVTDGFLLGDPHLHASPSADGSIPMEDRVLTAAAVGLQLHFGTDHDHIADYRPLVTALGLESSMRSVVADEVSPVRRGHMNIYPVEPVPDEPNGGAWAWWSELVPDTATQFAILRARHGDFVLQSNHPVESGLAQSADWSPGHIGRADRWSEDFDAVEVMNSSDYATHQPFFVDLLLRGLVRTPTGVSDAHGYLGSMGVSATFLGVGTNDPASCTDDDLREAMRAHRTVVSRGPYVETSVPPGSLVVGAHTVTVRALSPSWIQVDRLRLFRDGAVVAEVEGTEASFELAPEVDAAYWVEAVGDASMSPVWSTTPWAMTSPWRVDVTGDGWTAPLPPLVVSAD